jgi:transitional endoplasmic reticulum ATPase
MHGPPGTGKTMIAQAIANELDFNFIKFNITEVVSMWLGQTEKNVKAVFDKCRKLYEKTDKRVVLFVDEAEGLFKKRGTYIQSPAMERALDVWLQEVEQMYQHHGLIVVAATNRVEDFDKALMRRFKQIVQVPTPNKKALEEIFQKQLRRIENKREEFLEDNEIEYYPLFDELDIDKLASKCFNNELTGSDVEHVLENVRISIANSKNKEQYKINTFQVIEHIKQYIESRPQDVISKAIGFNNGN